MSDLKMPQINNLTITGRLCFDGELRYAATGTAYARNRLAVDDGFGEKKTTSFFSVVAFRKTAEILSELGRGAPVAIEGSVFINVREKGSETVEQPEIRCNRIHALSWDSMEPKPQPERDPEPETDDDLPF